MYANESIGSLCNEGSLLFKEDFGGNEVTSPISGNAIPEVKGYVFISDCINNYNTQSKIKNSYIIAKKELQNIGLDDHTYPQNITRGYLLRIYTDSIANQLYSKRIDGLCPGSTISFSAWLALGYYWTSNGTEGGIPNVKFLVEKTDGTILYTYESGVLPLKYPTWKQYGLSFTVPENITSLVFRMENCSKSSNISSYCVDDIEIKNCSLHKATINISSDTTICSHSEIELSSNFNNGDNTFDNIHYNWLKSNDGQTWTNFQNGQTISFIPSNTLYYKLNINGDSIKGQDQCSMLSDIIKISVNDLCSANDIKANDDSTTTTVNNLKIINALKNDIFSSCDQNSVKISVVKKTEHTKSAAFNSNNMLVYIPATDFKGKDSILYEINCNGTKSNAWIYIYVRDTKTEKIPFITSYIACPGAKVVISSSNNIKCKWYDKKEGGNLLGGGTSLTFTKTTYPIDFIWVNEDGADNEERIPITISLSEDCGKTENAICKDGIIIANEDFGGNEESDNFFSKIPSTQMSTSYKFASGGAGLGYNTYTIGKMSPNRNVWWCMSDHTSDDMRRGYCLSIDASETPGQFYEYQIDNLCRGVSLSFSAWLSSLEINNWGDKTNLIFMIEKLDGTPLVKFYTGDIPDSDPIWKQYGFDFNVPNDASSLKLRIINNGTGSNGNDFVMDDIEIKLCTPPIYASITPKDTVCEGESVTLQSSFINDGTFTEPVEKAWFKSSNGINNWTQIASGVDNIPLTSTKLEDQGYYKMGVTNSGGDVSVTTCSSSSNTLHLIVNACTNIKDTICSNSTYPFEGRNLNLTGTYADTIQCKRSSNDSIVTLELHVNPLIKSTLSNTICEGDTYNFNGKTLSIAGQYTDTLTSEEIKCDSIVTLDLKVNPIQRTSISASICEGSSFDFKEMSLNTEGTYNDTIPSVITGCDSIITLNLKVIPTTRTTFKSTICEGNIFTFGGRDLTSNGIYNDTIKSIRTGCDSISSLVLTVNPSKHEMIKTTICEGEKYNFNGIDYNATATATANLKTSDGCDSIVTLSLTMLPKKQESISENICNGENYNFGGTPYEDAGTYQHIFSSILTGCDSIVTLNLKVLPKSKGEINANICDGEFFSFDNKELKYEGDFDMHGPAINGCDSTTILHLKVFPKRESEHIESVSYGHTYNFLGKTLNSSGKYIDTLKTINGCDSVVTLRLTVETDPLKELSIPDGFSPNSDGTNDTFEIKGIEAFPESEIIIMNRWGNKLFDSKPASSWDGKNHEGESIGKDLPIGTYFYILKLGNGYNTKKGYLYLNK